MASLSMVDAASRTMDAPKKKGWKPGGQKGKLHRELGISTDKKIPSARLTAAEHSKDPEIKRDAIRAKTMEGWNHGGKKRSLYKKKD